MGVQFSYEFFPPKSDNGRAALYDTALGLAGTNPLYMTVTYGAGGSTRDGTFRTVTDIASKTSVPMAAHLTCASTKKDVLADYVDRLWGAGVKHIVALRGDLPDGWQWPKNDPDYFDYSSDFVAWLKDRHGFEVSVGTYPEKHPDAPSLDADIKALKLKQEAGADRAITQFFFDNQVYYDFVEQARAAGITIPIIPGLLPILDFEKMQNFAGRCQTSVPQWLCDDFGNIAGDQAAATAYAKECLQNQISDLAVNGCDHIHIYTLNKCEMLLAAIKA